MSDRSGAEQAARFGTLRELLHGSGALDTAALFELLQQPDSPSLRHYAWSMLERREDGERVWGWPMPRMDEVPLIVSKLDWCGDDVLHRLGATPTLVSGRRWGQVVTLRWEGDISTPLRLWMCSCAERLLIHKKLTEPTLWAVLRMQRRVLWCLCAENDLDHARALMLPSVEATSGEPFLEAAVLSVFWATHPDVVLGARKLVECVQLLSLSVDMVGLRDTLARWESSKQSGQASGLAR